MKKKARRNLRKRQKKKYVKETTTTVYPEKKVKTETASEIWTVSTRKKGSRVKTIVTKTIKKKTVSTYLRKETKEAKRIYAIREAAPFADQALLDAFEQLGFVLETDLDSHFSGRFSVAEKKITLKALDDCIYHELGHFLSFAAGEADRTSAFEEIFRLERSRYHYFNRSYVLQSASEYFAESYRNYVLEGEKLRSERPETYRAVCSALGKVTEERIRILSGIYSG